MRPENYNQGSRYVYLRERLILEGIAFESQANLLEHAIRIDLATLPLTRDPGHVAKDAFSKAAAAVALREGDPAEFDEFVANKTALDDVHGLYKALESSGILKQRAEDWRKTEPPPD